MALTLASLTSCSTAPKYAAQTASTPPAASTVQLTSGQQLARGARAEQNFYLMQGQPGKAAEIAASTNRLAATTLSMYGGQIITAATNGNFVGAALLLNELYARLPSDSMTRFDAVKGGVVMRSFDAAGLPVGQAKMNADQITNSLMTMKQMMESVSDPAVQPAPPTAPSHLHITHCDRMTSTDFTCFSLP